MLFVVCPCLALTIPFTNITEIYVYWTKNESDRIAWMLFVFVRHILILILTICISAHRASNRVSSSNERTDVSTITVAIRNTSTTDVFHFILSAALFFRSLHFHLICSPLDFLKRVSRVFIWLHLVSFVLYSGWCFLFQLPTHVFRNFLIFLMWVFFVFIFFFPSVFFFFACYLYLHFVNC